MNKELLQFIDDSPTAFHAVENIKKMLLENGFEQLFETNEWSLERNKKYFVIRNGSALFAFTTPNICKTIQISASHTDSPCLKVKNTPAMIDTGHIRVDVERYGGFIASTWFDRPLSFAGRIVYDDNGIKSQLFSLDDLSFVIPNVAIHLNRQANEGKQLSIQKEMLPIIGLGDSFNMEEYLQNKLSIKGEVLATETFIYNNQKGGFWGIENEFILAPRIDNLECTYAIVKSLLDSNNDESLNMGLFFDNEEVGSGTKQGADSSFLQDVLSRIKAAYDLTDEQYYAMIAKGFMISADNAHGYHPNFKELYSPSGAPIVNAGIVIKHNSNQQYTTDAISNAVFKKICKEADVATQDYYNHSNLPGGSTLGNIANRHVSLNTVDIGLAQWAMHSSMESAGSKDLDSLIKALTYFYNNTIVIEDSILGM